MEDRGHSPSLMNLLGSLARRAVRAATPPWQGPLGVVVGGRLEHARVGVSTLWQHDCTDTEVMALVGPVSVVVSTPPLPDVARVMDGLPAGHWSIPAGEGREVTADLSWRHVGATVQWDTKPNGRQVRLWLGPLQVTWQPKNALPPGWQELGYIRD